MTDIVFQSLLAWNNAHNLHINLELDSTFSVKQQLKQFVYI